MKKNKGQALIEFVLILPILFVLFTFIFEVGMIINEKSEVESKVTDTIYLWKKQNRQSFYSWKMDETYIKIKGRWHYLYRAIDADGLTLDIWLRKKRDTQAAYAFLKRLHKQFGEPKAIVTDKAPSLGSAFRKLQSVGLYTKTELSI